MPDAVAILARLLAFAWAGLWLFFFVAESWATHTPVRSALPWVALGVLFVVLATAACRWEKTGGALLALVGLAVAVLYSNFPPAALPVPARVATALFFGVPPVAAGVLFAVHRRPASR